eukprot:CAMPEP_0168690550 /NCGR_PEP_ID=MMETSP0503-20121227/32217_1 /TAXON_ID=89963 /ORGANISM="Heterocapsa rotundata, Strain SCCAP K-0483" /LENGTH=176 /DNA_ID=CAMNT_0008735929 /DNA_START=47 /DNA_END=574 /DNA_ORIENTATION=+
MALTLSICIALAFMGMLVFTRDLCLALFVVLSTCLVIASLAFFIVVVKGWAIGPIEVIALIVFSGYAVTYSLHVAHRYGGKHADEEDISDLDMFLPEGELHDADPARLIRLKRVHFAFRTIGAAACGSAATTAGCSVFLLFCMLTIFQKLGGVVLAVTFMSIMTALGPLPAALLVA